MFKISLAKVYLFRHILHGFTNHCVMFYILFTCLILNIKYFRLNTRVYTENKIFHIPFIPFLQREKIIHESRGISRIFTINMPSLNLFRYAYT